MCTVPSLCNMVYDTVARLSDFEALKCTAVCSAVRAGGVTYLKIRDNLGRRSWILKLTVSILRDALRVPQQVLRVRR